MYKLYYKEIYELHKWRMYVIPKIKYIQEFKLKINK